MVVFTISVAGTICKFVANISCSFFFLCKRLSRPRGRVNL